MFKMFQDFFNALSPRISNRPTSRVVMVLLVMVGASAAQADVYQWQWADPSDHSLGKLQSDILCPDGQGITPGPNTFQSDLNLSSGYFSSFDLSSSHFMDSALNDATFAGNAKVWHALFYQSQLSGADFSKSVTTFSLFGTCDLSKADFSGADLSYTGFRSSTLNDANFNNANLSNAAFHYSALSGANFSNANLTKTVFSFSVGENGERTGQLPGVNFTGATINGASFIGCYFPTVPSPMPWTIPVLTSAQLYSTASYQNRDLKQVILERNDMTGWDFHAMDLSLASLGYSNLQNANFAGVTLSIASLQGSELSGADFTGANLNGAYLGSATLSNAKLTNADLTNAHISGGRLDGADLTGAMIAGAELNYTTRYGLVASQLYSTASYQNHDLRGTSLDDNDLAGWDFHGVNLADAQFSNSILNRADFTGCNLTGVWAWGSRWDNTDLSDANMSGADLTNADFRGAINADLTTAKTTNAILPDGTVSSLLSGSALLVRNFEGTQTFPVHIVGQVSSPTSVQLEFDGQPWNSTITFATGIPVNFDGTDLALLLDPSVNPANMVGMTFIVFDWTGIDRVGMLGIHVSEYEWDTSRLYTDGSVTFVAVPEPAISAMCMMVAFRLASRRRSMKRRYS